MILSPKKLGDFVSTGSEQIENLDYSISKLVFNTNGEIGILFLGTDGVLDFRIYADGSLKGTYSRDIGNSYQYSDRLDLVSLPDGDFAIAWDETNIDGKKDVWIATLDNNAELVNIPTQANTYSINDQFSPVFSNNPSGNLVLAWNSTGQDGYDNSIFAKSI